MLNIKLLKRNIHFKYSPLPTLASLIAMALVMITTIVPCYAVSQNAVAVSAGDNHVLVLYDDGTVWAWGNNTYGQLGIGDSNGGFKKVPSQVPIKNIKAISAGNMYSLALMDDGTVWAWGSNTYGVLGDGTTDTRYAPIQVKGLTNVKAVLAGEVTSLALLDDGTVWAWGNNERGDLGNGGYTNSYTPVQVEGLTNVKSISNNFAIKNDGTVWAWGNNVFMIVGIENGSKYICGILGDNSSTRSRPIPFQVGTLSNVKDIAMGSSFNIILKDDGTVWAWGNNLYGQLGDGGSSGLEDYTVTPVQVGVNGVQAVSAGQFFSLALKQDGSVWTWGMRIDGKGSYEEGMPTPVQINGLDNVISISAGSSFGMALTKDGGIWGWGINQSGELGDGNGKIVAMPIQLIKGQRFSTTQPTSPTSSNPNIPNNTLTVTPNALDQATPTPTPTIVPISEASNASINPILIAAILALLIIAIGIISYLFLRKK